MRVSYTDWVDYFLIAIADEDAKRDGLIGSLEDVADDMGYDVPNNWIEKAITSFDPEYVKASRTTGPTRGLLTGEGLERVEQLRREKRPFATVSPTDDEYYAYRRGVLFALGDASEILSGGPHNVNFALHEFVDHIRKDWTIRAARDLESLGLVTFTIPENNADAITGDLTNLGGEYLAALGESIANERPLPASDRVVPLDHNSAPYQEATKAFDELIEVVRSDNEYGSRAPEEKEQLVASLTAGRRLLDGAKLRLSAANAILLPPLRYVADNFGKGVIAAAGTVALAAIVKLLGIL